MNPEINFETCPFCDGKGTKKDDFYGEIPCLECDGTGELPDDHSEICQLKLERKLLLNEKY